LIGSPFGRVLVGGHHQQIDIREAIPIAPSQGAVAEGVSAGVQPDAAVVWPLGVPQALAQRRDSPSLRVPTAPARSVDPRRS
jgi:homospermidine synthase